MSGLLSDEEIAALPMADEERHLRRRCGGWRQDRLEIRKGEYLREGPARSNAQYGYVTPPPGGIHHDVFA